MQHKFHVYMNVINQEAYEVSASSEAEAKMLVEEGRGVLMWSEDGVEAEVTHVEETTGE